MKKAIVTAIFGGYDDLKDPVVIDNEYDYLCFTDNLNLTSKVWRIIQGTGLTGYENLTPSNHLLSRFVKTSVCDLGYDEVIYIDGSMKIIGSMSTLTELYHKGGITICKHPSRDCAYEEAKTCIKMGFSPEMKANFQMLQYKMEGFPKHAGLIMGGFFIVTVNDITRNFFQKWWDQIFFYVSRDQFSFNYVAWKYGIRYTNIQDTDVFGKFVNLFPHLHKR